VKGYDLNGELGGLEPPEKRGKEWAARETTAQKAPNNPKDLDKSHRIEKQEAAKVLIAESFGTLKLGGGGSQGPYRGEKQPPCLERGGVFLVCQKIKKKKRRKVGVTPSQQRLACQSIHSGKKKGQGFQGKG